MNGKLITLEGIDGAGKSSVIKKVFEHLKKEYPLVKLVLTREPGGNQVSDQIRKLILNQNIDCYTELLLYEASRREHFIHQIAPILKQGGIVICDRFTDSTIAYQGYGRQLGELIVKALNDFVVDIKPNLTLFFDVDLKTASERIANHRQNEINRLDQEKRVFYQKVIKGYQATIESDPQRFRVINANRKFENVYNEVYAILSAYIYNFRDGMKIDERN